MNNIDKNFTQIIDSSDYQTCIKDTNEFVRLKDSITTRVTYQKDKHSFCFWFLPELENTTTYYEIMMELDKHPAEVMLNAMYKLSSKKWYDINVQQDFLALFRYIIGEEKWKDISSYTD